MSDYTVLAKAIRATAQDGDDAYQFCINLIDLQIARVEAANGWKDEVEHAFSELQCGAFALQELWKSARTEAPAAVPPPVPASDDLAEAMAPVIEMPPVATEEQIKELNLWDRMRSHLKANAANP